MVKGFISEWKSESLYNPLKSIKIGYEENLYVFLSLENGVFSGWHVARLNACSQKRDFAAEWSFKTSEFTVRYCSVAF